MPNFLVTAGDRKRIAAAQDELALAAERFDRAADRLDDIRLNAELRAATAGADWWDSPAGRRHSEVTQQLRAEAAALRTKTLPDISRLR